MRIIVIKKESTLVVPGLLLISLIDDDKIKDDLAILIANQHLIRVSADQGFVLDYECLVQQIKNLL